MNANDVIESYVTDVAVRLPRKQRNDVAFELRALLNEGLQDKAEAAGCAADTALAIEFVRAFGRPEEVAARYRPALIIIDPADGRSFLRAAVIGLLLIWCLGLLQFFQQPIGSGSDFLRALGQWWAGTLIPSLWWPGLLVVGFGASAWARRRWPENSNWKPRADDQIVGGRAAMVMALVGLLCGLSVLLNPGWLLDVFFGGRAAPAAYQALTYTDAFRHRQGPFLLVLIVLNIPVFVTMIVRGRRPALLRRAETALALATCVVLAWAVLDGPVMMTRASDAMMKLSMGLIVVFTLIGVGAKWRRSVRPTPDQRVQAQR